MYNHVEMIVVLYLNFFCIRNILPKSVYVCALEIFQQDVWKKGEEGGK